MSIAALVKNMASELKRKAVSGGASIAARTLDTSITYYAFKNYYDQIVEANPIARFFIERNGADGIWLAYAISIPVTTLFMYVGGKSVLEIGDKLGIKNQQARNILEDSFFHLSTVSSLAAAAHGLYELFS